MMHQFRFLIAGLLFCFIFSSCEKELSQENFSDTGGSGTAGGTAKYSLSGTPGNCTDVFISGDYKKGVALTASNIAEITVDVDSVGTYIVSTNSVNGISFSGSGTFTDTGEQTIELTGTGTPLADGIFTLKPGNGCTFLITVTNDGSSGGTAVFTLAGAPGNCTAPAVNGTYTAGTALNAANTIVLSVNVTTVGTYTVSTSSNNGISFSGSGNFASTGVQNVTLTGSGTANAAGAFAFVSGFGGCSFTVLVDGTGGTPTADYYFDVTIDGERIIKYADGVPGGYGLGYGTSGFDDVEYSTIISPIENPIPPGMPYIDVGKGLFLGSFSATEQAFKNFFPVGSFPYSAPNSMEGIHIVWVDKNEKIWETNNNPGTQTGSDFSITSVEDYHNIFGAYVVKFSATFNCKLYDDAGNSITLTNGKIIGEFQK